jgi:hypothetical protein
MVTKNLYLFAKENHHRFSIVSSIAHSFIYLRIEKLNERVGAWLIKEQVEVNRDDLIELRSFIDDLLKDSANEQL